MEKQQIIQQQFFELSGFLNSTNNVQNKIFQTYFYEKRINGTNFIFAGISDCQKIALVKQLRHKHWVRTENTHHKELEDFIALKVPECREAIDLTKCLKKHILGI